MKIQGKKLVTKKNSKGFTLLELTISLFLLLILSLLLTLILQTTIKTSRNFLDFTNYEYALAHKKILEIYNDSSKVERESNFVMMTNKDKKEEVKLVFQGDRVYIAKQKSKDFYAGYILLLKKLKSYSIEQDEDMIHITLRDREDKERNLYLKLMINNQLRHRKIKMINKKTTMLKDKQGNAIIVSLLVTMLVVVVMFSVVGIYMNKMYSIKNINNYYDKKIIEQLNKEK